MAGHLRADHQGDDLEDATAPNPGTASRSMRMSGGEGGPRVVEVVSATRDGKDVTAKTRADATKAQAEARQGAGRSSDGKKDRRRQ